MRKIKNIIAFILVSLVLFSCKEEVKTFTTNDCGLPTVKIYDVKYITATSATCDCIVTDDGGFDVTARGVCWSTNQNPTISDEHTTDGTGTGSYTSYMTNMSSNTTYYVRAYATNSYGTIYGEQKTFETMTVPAGAIAGVFSVSETKQVFFSQGNLQYQASTDTWRFAENQYDYIGNDNSNISATYSGWIDLFGWGTSGYNHGAICYQPYSTSENYGDYYAYGNYIYNLNDQTGQADWGCNAIANGGNTTKAWRTLTNDEWKYVFDVRNTYSGMRYAKANVNGINGVILLPDDWISMYNLNNINNSEASFRSNIITEAVWTNTFEENGAVFLPAAGYRIEASISNTGYLGLYWSGSYYSSSIANSVHFVENSLNPSRNSFRTYGCSVRLVR